MPLVAGKELERVAGEFPPASSRSNSVEELEGAQIEWNGNRTIHFYPAFIRRHDSRVA